MKTMMKRWLCAAAVLLTAPMGLSAESIPVKSADPYLGAIVIDADTGDVLFEDNADAPGYPASVIKLLDLLVILENVESKAIALDDAVTVNAEAARMGGSQVYLKEKEIFTVDELLYALMVQSANDAAVALAIRIAGTKDGFVEMTAERARTLGMSATEVRSVHGLPPGAGQEPDVTTARDLAILCRELARRPEVFAYTAVKERGFRDGTFIMRNHNPLLDSVEGCDGFKTGYFTKAGYSIAATAKRGDSRVIAVVLDSKDRKVRNAKAAELLAKGFLELAKRKAAKK